MKNEICYPADGGQLLTQGFNMSAAATSTTTANFTVPTGRGNIKKITITVGDNTVADLADSNLTLLVNGKQIIIESSLTYYGSNYQDRKEFCVDIPEKATLQATVVNNSASVIPLNINADFII